MTTALSIFAANIQSVKQANALLFVSVSGGGVTSAPQTVNTSTGWGELEFGVFTTWASGGSIGAPSGNGGLYDGGATILTGQTIAAGNWSGSFFFFTSQSGKTLTGPLTLRVYKYDITAETYAAIGSITTSSQVITSTGITVSFPSTSFGSMAFTANQTLYCDCWMDITANTMTSGGGVSVQFSTSATLGLATATMVTPGFNPTPTSHIIMSDSMVAGVSPGGV